MMPVFVALGFDKVMGRCNKLENLESLEKLEKMDVGPC